MRRILENAFDILENHWRVFSRSFHLEPEKFKSVTLVGITLHVGLKDPDKGEVMENSLRFQIMEIIIFYKSK